MNSNILLKSTKSSVALEIIKFQNDNFGEDIGVYVEQILSLYKNNKIDKDRKNLDKILTDLEILFNKRLGLKVTFFKDDNPDHTYCEAFMQIVSLNDDHIFFTDKERDDPQCREDVEIALKQITKKEGYVDTEKARVSGFFSEIENKLYIDFNKFSAILSVRETTAIILHELGHAFTFFEYSDRIESTNQIMANTLKELYNNDKDEKSTYIFKELSKLEENLKEEDVDELLSKDKTIISLRLFKIFNNNIKSIINRKYDETTSEALADNFASKFGYGKDLITGLEASYNNDNVDRNYNDLKTKNIYQLTSLESTILVAKLIAVGNVTTSSFIPGIVLLTCFTAGDDNRDMTYDNLVIRYKRIREEELSRLKEGDLSNEQIKSIVNIIKEIDDVLKPMENYTNFDNVIGNFLFNSNKRAKNEMTEQRLLEELQSNDLLLSMNKLKLNKPGEEFNE